VTATGVAIASKTDLNLAALVGQWEGAMVTCKGHQPKLTVASNGTMQNPMAFT